MCRTNVHQSVFGRPPVCLFRMVCVRQLDVVRRLSFARLLVCQHLLVCESRLFCDHPQFCDLRLVGCQHLLDCLCVPSGFFRSIALLNFPPRVVRWLLLAAGWLACHCLVSADRFEVPHPPQRSTASLERVRVAWVPIPFSDALHLAIRHDPLVGVDCFASWHLRIDRWTVDRFDHASSRFCSKGCWPE